jgi:chromosome segregation ATPase
MAKVFHKRDEEESQDAEETPLSKLDYEEEIALVLQQLSDEEATLQEQKENLDSLKVQLQKKVKEEIDNRRNSIQKLKSEVKDLKTDCEKLNRSLRAIQNLQQSEPK